MKNKFLFIALMVALFACLFAFSASAAVTTYDDAPTRTNIQVKTDEVIEFKDGFICPSAYVFKDVTKISDNNAFATVMDFSYVNGKLGKTEENAYTYADVVGFDIPSGFTYIGKYAGRNDGTLKWVTFPNSITGLADAIFENAKGLEKCVMKFDETHTIKTFPAWMFYGCTNLKAFSMPDCFTTISKECNFTNCTSMTAVYLSKNLTTWTSNGGGMERATFDKCYNMYFVNEPFTYDEIPSKPTVYYFPPNLRNTDASNDFSKMSTMRNCNSLNDVLVFGENVTELSNAYFFQAGPKNTIVFLGNMENVSTGWWGTTERIVFANPNDKSSSDIASYNNSRNTIFCHAEGNTAHFAEKTVDVEAKCGIDAAEVTLCFCGHEITRKSVLGTALSHDYDYLNNKNATLVSIAYTAYGVTGTKTVSCAHCKENGTVEASALFVSLGYSAPEDGRGALAIGFLINTLAIQEYEEISGISLTYGGFAVLKDRIEANDIFDESGSTISGVVSAEISKQTVTAFELKIMGFETEEHKALELAMGAYVVEKDTEGNCKYLYIQDSAPSAGAKYTFTTYNENV